MGETGIAIFAAPAEERRKELRQECLSYLRADFGRHVLPVGGFGLLEGVIGRADERAGFDVFEAHGFAADLEFGELAGMNVADDGQMIARGLEILAERQNVGSLRGEILQRGENFFFFFAEAKHQARFGGNVRMRLFCAAEQFERTLVERAFADLAIEAGNGFGVVIQHVGLGGKNDVERDPITAKIRN